MPKLAKVRVYPHLLNREAQRLADGVAQSVGKHLFFVDGDLVDLEPAHLRRIAEPVLTGNAMMSVSFFGSGGGSTRQSHVRTSRQSTVAFTLDVYTDAVTQMQEDASDKVAGLIFGSPEDQEDSDSESA